jgi:hypothetical protein
LNVTLNTLVVFGQWIFSEYLRNSKQKSLSEIGMTFSFLQSFNSLSRLARNFNASDFFVSPVDMQVFLPFG